jgi:hypothetical protein
VARRRWGGSAPGRGEALVWRSGETAGPAVVRARPGPKVRPRSSGRGARRAARKSWARPRGTSRGRNGRCGRCGKRGRSGSGVAGRCGAGWSRTGRGRAPGPATREARPRPGEVARGREGCAAQLWAQLLGKCGQEKWQWGAAAGCYGRTGRSGPNGVHRGAAWFSLAAGE